MKRYGYLWEKIVNYDNLLLAHQEASKGKRKYRQVQKINENLDLHIKELINLLESGTYKTSEYTPRILNERGKERLIHRLPYWPDRVVHHAFVQILSPIWQKSMIRQTYASIPGRGIHDAKKDVLKALRNDTENTQYCLKIDIEKYYPSISHDKLLEILHIKIKDKRVMNILEEIIRSISIKDDGIGIPIGNFLSQWFANIYLTPCDWRIKQFYNIKYYFRYCDDMVMLHSNKEYLHTIKNDITEWLQGEYFLKVKDNWQIYPTKDRGIDFVGYRMWIEKVLIRNKTKKRMAKKLSISKCQNSQKAFKNGLNAIPSYNGWIQHGSAYKLTEKILKPWEIYK